MWEFAEYEVREVRNSYSGSLMMPGEARKSASGDSTVILNWMGQQGWELAGFGVDAHDMPGSQWGGTSWTNRRYVFKRRTP